MEMRSPLDRVRYYRQYPMRGLADARGNLKRMGRFCLAPNRLVNLVRAKIARHAEIVSTTPRHVALFPTDRCDIDCRWCLRNSAESRHMRHEPVSDMTLEVFKKILQRLPALEAVSFTGQGEPLLNRELFQMMEYARRKHLTLLLTTNGLPLNQEKIEALIRLGLFRINVSLKGKDAADYERTTGRGKESFERQIENVRQCVALKKKLKSDIIVQISYVVEKKYLGHLEDVIVLGEELGVDRVLFNNLIPFHDFENGEGCLFEDDPDVRAVIARLERRSSPILIDLPVLLRRRALTRYCPGYYEILHVDAQGDVTGCMRDLAPNRSYGNLFLDADIMNTPHFRETRRRFLENDLPERCRYCVEMSRC